MVLDVGAKCAMEFVGGLTSQRPVVKVLLTTYHHNAHIPLRLIVVCSIVPTAMELIEQDDQSILTRLEQVNNTLRHLLRRSSWNSGSYPGVSPPRPQASCTRWCFRGRSTLLPCRHVVNTLVRCYKNQVEEICMGRRLEYNMLAICRWTSRKKKPMHHIFSISKDYSFGMKNLCYIVEKHSPRITIENREY